MAKRTETQRYIHSLNREKMLTFWLLCCSLGGHRNIFINHACSLGVHVVEFARFFGMLCSTTLSRNRGLIAPQQASFLSSVSVVDNECGYNVTSLKEQTVDQSLVMIVVFVAT